MNFNLDNDELDLDALEGALGGVSQEFGEEKARKSQISELKELREKLTQTNNLGSDELTEEELENYSAGINRR